MNRRLPLSAFLLAILCLVFAFAARGQELRHGHLVDIPSLLDRDGTVWTSAAHAFLAVKLPVVPITTQIVDYTQEVDYLSTAQFDLRDGGVIGRSAYTNAATWEGWLILRVSKPCAPGEIWSDVGYVTVCEPRPEGGVMDACRRIGGPAPIYAGVPEERVLCIAKRRVVRR